MITHGSILIDENAPRPQCFRAGDGSGQDGWTPVTHNNLTFQEFEKELTAAGWTFFYMANAIKTIAFGFDRAKAVHTALQRLIEQVKRQHCNCLEIEDVAAHSFLGLPYVSISAHPRHVQKGMVFAGTAAT